MTHADIIKDPEAIAAHLGVSVHTVRSWRQRKSIPSDQWPPLIAGGFATLEELSPRLAEVIRPEADAA
jgi:hypothetical protein